MHGGIYFALQGLVPAFHQVTGVPPPHRWDMGNWSCLGGLDTGWEQAGQAVRLERKTGFGEAGWMQGKVWQGARLGKAGVQSSAEKQELEEKPWATEASRRWGGGKGGGICVVSFGIKLLGYL